MIFERIVFERTVSGLPDALRDPGVPFKMCRPGRAGKYWLSFQTANSVDLVAVCAEGGEASSGRFNGMGYT